MRETMNRPPQSGQPLPRNELMILLQTGLSVNNFNFVRQAAQQWLDAYPGDLQVALILAQALTLGGSSKHALPVVEGLCQKDPEFLMAQELLAWLYAHKATPDQNLATAEGNVFALGSIPNPGQTYKISITLPGWSQVLLEARQSLANGNLDLAEERMQSALSGDAVTPLVGLTHLQILYRRPKSQPSAQISPLRTLSEFYNQRWPECLPITLLLAETLMDGGESDHGVALLHKVAAQDVAGQVTARLWGKDHPYRNLWPEWLAVELDLAIPAAVAACLGWNQLPNPQNEPNVSIQAEESYLSIPGESPEVSSRKVTRERTRERTPQYLHPKDRSDIQIKMPQHQPERHQQTKGENPAAVKYDIKPAQTFQPYPANQPETLISTQDELDKIAMHLKQPQLVRTEGRFPVYIVFSTRKGLTAQYGQTGFEALDNALRQLVMAIKIHRNWGARLLYADDPRSAAAVGIKPTSTLDPWSLKLALADLDGALAKGGEMIGAVLIVGGPEIVPFHNLPNPVDDSDLDVPSDNPYATRDENYFVPEWPVGRLPGGNGNDPKFLLKLIQYISQEHQVQSKSRPWYLWLLETLFGWLLPGKNGSPNPSFGYTAAVWKQASYSVFKPIGSANALLVSPPSQSNDFLSSRVALARLGYFNLHGVPNAPEWFGQADATHGFSDDDYPTALRPQDVRNSGQAPQVVFTEACYGAFILGKSVDQALSLKFTSAGTRALVGSTCTCYGSVNDPLIAADLLGNAFWKNLKNGLPAGEALRQAKIALVREMDQRQGYLDGEDQKTLISFLLYGDPLAHMGTNQQKPKEILRPLDAPTVNTVIEEIDEEAIKTLPTFKLDVVKQVVQQYLPGMIDAQISLSNMHTPGGTSARAQAHSPHEPTKDPGTKLPLQVVTLHKQVAVQAKLHQHFARLTMDENGKVVKMTVSR